jgi:UDP-glucose 4-epimerase
MPTDRKSARPASVMIVGGAGFIGSHLTERLLADGVRVEVVDDLSSGSLNNLAVARERADEGALRIDTADVRIPEFVDLMTRRRPDVVVLCAAFIGEQDDVADAIRSFAVAASVLEACRVAGISKVVVTIPGVLLYGDVPARELPIKEDRPHQPVGVVGVAVEATLGLLETYRRDHSLDFTALAMSTVYGPRQRHGIVADFARAKRSGSSPTVFGDGKQTSDIVFVDDAVDAISRSLTKGSGQIIHVSSGQQTSLRSLLEAMGIETVIAEPRRPRLVQRSALSPLRARLHLGWTPWTSLTDGVAATLAVED